MLQITNNNTKIQTDKDVYKTFNEFIFSNDIRVIGKLLHRFDFFTPLHILNAHL